MRTHPLSTGALCLTLLLLACPQAQAAAKHFRASLEHFHEYAAKAAELYFKAETPTDRHILGHLTSISTIYAEKAATVMYLVDVQEHMSAKRDRIVVAERIQEVKRQNALTLPQDVKLLADLVEAQGNETIRSLGNLVINEIRVFERNLDNL
jgi:hypothetical protein